MVICPLCLRECQRQRSEEVPIVRDRKMCLAYTEDQSEVLECHGIALLRLAAAVDKK